MFVPIIPSIDLGGVPMSLLTFVRKDPHDEVRVSDAIAAINRLLERTYPDCTCCLYKSGDSGLASQWVTVELEVTRESLPCLEWYITQATTAGLALAAWKSRQAPLLEVDLAEMLRPVA
jgi:hypothetical protein